MVCNTAANICLSFKVCNSAFSNGSDSGSNSEKLISGLTGSKGCWSVVAGTAAAACPAPPRSEFENFKESHQTQVQIEVPGRVYDSRSSFPNVRPRGSG